VIRTFKLAKMIRMIRLFKVFRELRIMLYSIVATMRTLFWAIVCLVLIMSAFSVYFITVVADYQAAQGPQQEYQDFFGSVVATLITLFKASTGGFDWGEVSDLLWTVSPLSSYVFFGYISMMEYLILNILTGICCSTASKTAEEDTELSIHDNDAQQNGVAVKLRRFLRNIDLEGTGTISWQQLEKHLHDSKLRNGFKQLDLEPWHLQNFFHVLRSSDDEQEPSMPIDQFIRVCMRFRCTVKNIDLIAANHQQQERHIQHFHELSSKIDELCSVLRPRCAHV